MTPQQIGLMQADFRLFLKEVWAFHGLPEPTHTQYDIAHWLQHGPDDRGVMAQRGEGKTWITVAFVVWKLWVKNSTRALLVSETLGHAKRSLMLARQWIESIPWLRHLRPKHGTKQRDGAEQFDIGPSTWDRMASCTAIGITGQITGMRSNLIVPDDIESGENTLTPAARMLLRERVKELENIKLPDAEMVVLGTYHNDESIYTGMQEVGYTFHAWPARYPKPDEETELLAPLLRRKLRSGAVQAGDPVTPDRFNDEYLLGREMKIGRAEFRKQYMLDPSASDAEDHPLKLADLVVYPCHAESAPVSIGWGHTGSDGSTQLPGLPCQGFADDMFYGPAFVSPERSRYHGTRMVVDPAGGGADTTAWAIIGQLHGMLFLKNVGGYVGPHDPTNLTKIVQAARRHAAQEIHIETNFGGDMLIQLLKPLVQKHSKDPGDHNYPNGWTARLEGYHTASRSGHKEQRMTGIMDPCLLSHRLVIDPSVAQSSEWQYQFTRLNARKGCLKHDDYIDATSKCVELFMDALDQDNAVQATTLLDDRRMQGLDEAMAEYQDDQPLSWVNF